MAILGILYFFFGSIACLLICVNPNDPGILGKFRRLCFNTIPTAFRYSPHHEVHSCAASSAREPCSVWEGSSTTSQKPIIHSFNCFTC